MLWMEDVGYHFFSFRPCRCFYGAPNDNRRQGHRSVGREEDRGLARLRRLDKRSFFETETERGGLDGSTSCGELEACIALYDGARREIRRPDPCLQDAFLVCSVSVCMDAAGAEQREEAEDVLETVWSHGLNDSSGRSEGENGSPAHLCIIFFHSHPRGRGECDDGRMNRFVDIQ